MPVNRACAVMLVIGLATGSALAEETDEAADAELLEFIGSFMTETGGWVDPEEFEESPPSQISETEVAQ